MCVRLKKEISGIVLHMSFCLLAPLTQHFVFETCVGVTEVTGRLSFHLCIHRQTESSVLPHRRDTQVSFSLPCVPLPVLVSLSMCVSSWKGSGLAFPAL